MPMPNASENAPTRAIFLSVRIQDVGAARCICDVLRAVGLEVWSTECTARR